MNKMIEEEVIMIKISIY